VMVHVYHLTQHNIPEDLNLQHYSCENGKSHIPPTCSHGQSVKKTGSAEFYKIV
jgi:hypothetical protein